MRRPERRLATLVLLLAGLPACTGDASGCTTPEEQTVSSVMERARTGFPAGDSTIARQELVRSSQIALPEDLREAGGVAVLALRTARFEADPASRDFPGIEVTNLFLLDEREQVVAPIGRFATDGFDYRRPGSADWEGLTTRLQDSEPVEAVSLCAAP